MLSNSVSVVVTPCKTNNVVKLLPGMSPDNPS
ncbi:hypothetical protein J814_2943, partial [Acinetobacter baumannii 25766_1]